MHILETLLVTRTASPAATSTAVANALAATPKADPIVKTRLYRFGCATYCNRCGVPLV